MRKTTSRIFFGITMLCLSIFSIAQVRPQTTDSTRSSGPGSGQRPSVGVRPYKEIITDKAITKNGFFKVTVLGFPRKFLIKKRDGYV